MASGEGMNVALIHPSAGLTSVDALDRRRVDSFLSRGAKDGTRRVHRATLILTRRLTVLATGSVDGVHHGDKLLLVGANLEHDFAVAKRVERKVLTSTDTIAGVELRLMRKRYIKRQYTVASVKRKPPRRNKQHEKGTPLD